MTRNPSRRALLACSQWLEYCLSIGWKREHLDMPVMADVTAPAFVQVEIRDDGKVIWVNTENGCVFRACRIGDLTITDRREA